ncbi:MAG: hypothetical protein KKA60_14750 [Proteobacteria bacterium]|nr:hypothetical protein [Pseudomonadota bacterium]
MLRDENVASMKDPGDRESETREECLSEITELLFDPLRGFVAMLEGMETYGTAGGPVCIQAVHVASALRSLVSQAEGQMLDATEFLFENLGDVIFERRILYAGPLHPVCGRNASGPIVSARFEPPPGGPLANTARPMERTDKATKAPESSLGAFGSPEIMTVVKGPGQKLTEVGHKVFCPECYEKWAGSEEREREMEGSNIVEDPRAWNRIFPEIGSCQECKKQVFRPGPVAWLVYTWPKPEGEVKGTPGGQAPAAG